MTDRAKKLLTKERYDINDLLEIMSILRSDDGCPWDREQTHESIRKNFIEETYEVVEAIETVAEGGSYFSQELLSSLVSSLRTTPQPEVAPEDEESLSERELEVLLEICKGLSNQQIADKLFISKRTVDKHRANILAKTGCPNTANLVVYAIKHNLVEI